MSVATSAPGSHKAHKNVSRLSLSRTSGQSDENTTTEHATCNLCTVAGSAYHGGAFTADRLRDIGPPTTGGAALASQPAPRYLGLIRMPPMHQERGPINNILPLTNKIAHVYFPSSTVSLGITCSAPFCSFDSSVLCPESAPFSKGKATCFVETRENVVVESSIGRQQLSHRHV